jgi:hypothetical protein
MFGTSSIAKLGQKIAGGSMKGLRIGEKVTGAVAKLGHKVRDYGKYATLAAGALGPEAVAAVGAAVGVAGKVGDAAQTANTIIKNTQAGARGAQNALAAGNKQQALGIMRDTAKDQFAAGKSLKSAAKSVMERK